MFDIETQMIDTHLTQSSGHSGDSIGTVWNMKHVATLSERLLRVWGLFKGTDQTLSICRTPGTT